MFTTVKQVTGASFLALALAVIGSGQSGTGSVQRSPTTARRQFVVLPNQSLIELERKLQPENKVEDLIGGEGMQLRVAVQHEKNMAPAPGELHDESDDVYYVLEGGATLTLGGKLEAPHEIQPGEWRSSHIIGGQTFEVSKGDLIIVPRGTPHQRGTTNKDFTMILIKVFATPIRETKTPSNTPAPVAKPEGVKISK